MITQQALFGKVCDTLGTLTYSIRLRSAGGDLGVNKAAESFYCGLLNILLSTQDRQIRLRNMNDLRTDFPAVDLGDAENGLAVQVTTTEHRGKVNHTLQKFFENHLDETYDRLILLVIGKKDEHKKAFTVLRGFDFDPGRDIWDLDRLGQELGKLEQDALERLDAYLTEKLDQVPRQARVLRLKFPASLSRDAFVGRERELRELAERMADGANAPIVLSGLGGMGKTELAARFCADHTGGNVYFLRFRESFTKTLAMGVAEGIEGYLDQKPSEEEAYGVALERLRNFVRGDILVIDNADEPSGDFGALKADPAFRELKKMELRLLLTTRCEVPRAIRVGHMENATLYQIFENHGCALTVQQMDDLIGAVNGHTMTVDLMARTLKRNRRLTVEKLLEALREGDLANQNYRPVGSDRSGEEEQEQIYGHLRRLFNVAEVTEAGRELLCNMVLLPEGGMDMAILEDAMDEAALECLDEQIDHGWLVFDEETRFVSIHPVVRLVCREELKPDNDSCEDFLDAVLEGYDPAQYDAGRFRQLAELFSRAADLLQDPEVTWALMAGRLWSNLGQAENAVRYEQRLADLCKENDDDPEWQAIVYNNLGNTCLILGEYAKALEYTQISLEAWKKVRAEDHQDMAIPYNNLGLIHCALGSYEESVEYTLKALRIQETSDPENFYNLGRLHNNLGQTYLFLAEHTKALEHTLKAIALWEKELSANHPELGTLCNNAGLIYSALGNHTRSLAYSHRALKIWEDTLPEDHPDRAKALNNLGMIYRCMGRMEEARKNTLRALEIWEKVLPENHPDLGLCYGNLGELCFDQEDLEEARTFILKALGILEKALPADHPNLAMLDRDLGMICVKQGKAEEGLELLLKAVKIWRNALPAGHPNLGMGYESVSQAYEILGNQKQSLRYKLAAARVYEKAKPEDHTTLMNIYKELGNAFASMGRHRSAIPYKCRALEIYEKQNPEDAELAALYSSVGFSCFKAGELWQCRKYSLKALEIARRCLPKDDKNLEIYLKNAAVVLKMIKERERSVQEEPTE